MSTVSRRPRARKAEPQVMRLTFSTADDCYLVSPTPVDPAIGHAAWKLNKLTGNRAVYYVLHGHEGWHCECPAFLRWGPRRPCKHVRMVLAARAVFAGQRPPLAAEVARA